jgi:hypothetical protein
MASDTIQTTLSVDNKPLEQGLESAGRSVQKWSKEFQDAQKKGYNRRVHNVPQTSMAEKVSGFAMSGGSGMMAAALGLPGIVAEAIGAVISGIKKLAAEAKNLQNISNATGVSTGKLQEMKSLAETTGLSLETIAHSMAEFNKKMGEAKIRGSEANAAIAKLGYSLKSLHDGSFTYEEAIRALNGAYKAGTDDATMMHYATTLFGSSAEQIMPIVKRGNAQIMATKNFTYTTTKESINSLSTLGDAMSVLWESIKNIAIEAVGQIASGFMWLVDSATNALTRFINWKSGPIAAAKAFAGSGDFKSDKEVLKQAREIAGTMDSEDREKFYAEVKRIIGDKGKKLSPLGLSEAVGASSLQQMGGGDIFSAISFTPLDRIATATEDTEENTWNMLMFMKDNQQKDLYRVTEITPNL